MMIERKSVPSPAKTLMAMDVRELAKDPANAARFLARLVVSVEALRAQLRREWGLNSHEMLSINLLWEYGEMPMSELAQRVPLSRAAVTSLVDRLEQLGLVKRVPDAVDRRRILLEVTEKAESILFNSASDWIKEVSDYVAALDQETWLSAVKVMSDLRDITLNRVDTMRKG